MSQTSWIVAVLSLITVIAVIARQGLKSPRGLGLLNALRELLPKNAEEEHTDVQRIGRIILDSYNEYRADARNWSGIYFGCLFLSAACAAFAGLVIKLEWLDNNDGFRKDLAATLAMLSALLVTLSTAGGFHQHWWVNRLAAAKMEKLGYAFITADWTDKKAALDAFSSQIQAISYERNQNIVASDNSKPEPPKTK
jgi:hypothetical protein